MLIGDTAIIWGTDERPVCGYIVEDNTEILINVGFPNPGLRQQSVMFKGLNLSLIHIYKIPHLTERNKKTWMINALWKISF